MNKPYGNNKFLQEVDDIAKIKKSDKFVEESSLGKEVAEGGWSSLHGNAKNSKWVSPKQGIEGPGLRDHFAKHGDQLGAKTRTPV